MESESRRLQVAVAEILRTLSLPPLEAFDLLSRCSNGGSDVAPPGPSPTRLPAVTSGPGATDRSLPVVRFLSELPSPHNIYDGRRQNHAAGMAMSR